MQSDADERQAWLMWLTRLRWVALFAQTITLGFSIGVLSSPTLLIPLAIIICALALANVRALQVMQSENDVADETLLWQLGLDVLALTTFFLLAGGPDNPFVVLYFVHIAMGSVMLKPSYAAILTSMVTLCYALLHVYHLPLHYDRHILPETALRPLGQLLSFVISATSVGVFVGALAETLRRRKRQLLSARDKTARTDRLRSVGTLAAGAAHELNTPLSTIGLRVRRVKRRHTDDDTSRDLEVIQAQLERCSRVVEQLLVGAGDPSAAGFERRPLAELVEEGVRLWNKGSELDVQFRDESEAAMVELPRVAFTQALINLLENAREAQLESSSSTPLEVVVRAEPDKAIVEVRDHGCGLPNDAETRVGEPFYTTKATGTGLGVFVARAVADGAGGGLRYVSHSDGTTACWWFPQVRRSP